MYSQVYIPNYPLSGFIDNFYYYKMDNPVNQLNRFLPDGNVQMLFDLSEEKKSIYDNNSLRPYQTCDKVWYSGFRTKSITIPTGFRSEMLIVSFKKGCSFPFLKSPVYTFADEVVEASESFGSQTLDWWHILKSVQDPLSRFRKLEQLFIEAYHGQFKEVPIIAFSIRFLDLLDGEGKVSDIMQHIGYSQKHFIQLFKQHVGVSPKKYLQIKRFQGVIQQLENEEGDEWTRIAYDAGYFDQSHFIADFRKYAGLTPGEYVKAKGDFLNYLPVGEIR